MSLAATPAGARDEASRNIAQRFSLHYAVASRPLSPCDRWERGNFYHSSSRITEHERTERSGADRQCMTTAGKKLDICFFVTLDSGVCNPGSWKLYLGARPLHLSLGEVLLFIVQDGSKSPDHHWQSGLERQGEESHIKTMRRGFPFATYAPSHWLECSHMATDTWKPGGFIVKST